MESPDGVLKEYKHLTVFVEFEKKYERLKKAKLWQSTIDESSREEA